MSEENPAAETATEEHTEQQEQAETKPTETVEFWKAKAREQEKRAKANADAAAKLAQIEESQKTEDQKRDDRVKAAEAEVAAIPQKVSEALRAHLVDIHKISDEDAELFLTATDPDLLLKQVARLVAQAPHSPLPNPQQGNPSQSRGGTLSAGRERYAAQNK